MTQIARDGQAEGSHLFRSAKMDLWRCLSTFFSGNLNAKQYGTKKINTCTIFLPSLFYMKPVLVSICVQILTRERRTPKLSDVFIFRYLFSFPHSLLSFIPPSLLSFFCPFLHLPSPVSGFILIMKDVIHHYSMNCSKTLPSYLDEKELLMCSLLLGSAQPCPLVTASWQGRRKQRRRERQVQVNQMGTGAFWDYLQTKST